MTIGLGQCLMPLALRGNERGYVDRHSLSGYHACVELGRSLTQHKGDRHRLKAEMPALILLIGTS